MGRHETGNCLGAIFVYEPVSEINDNPREKSCLRQSQQKPHGVELMRGADEGHPNRDHSPGDHDARDPAPCTPSLVDEGAGNFQNDVAEGKDARSEADYAIIEAEIVRHLQRGSGKIVAIKVGNYVKQESIWQQTQANPTAGATSNVIGDNERSRQFVSAQVRLADRTRDPRI